MTRCLQLWLRLWTLAAVLGLPALVHAQRSKQTFSQDKPHPYFMLKGRDAYTLVFSPGGRWLAVGYSTATVALWDTRTKRLQWRRSWGGEYGEVLAAAFSPDGKMVAFGQANGSENWFLFVYSTGYGKVKYQFRGKSDKVTALAFSPRSPLLASGSTRFVFIKGTPSGSVGDRSYDYNEARLWDLRHKHHSIALLWHGSGTVLDLAFTPDARLLDCVGEDGTLYVRDIQRQKQRTLLILDKVGFTKAKFSADAEILATAKSDGGPRKDEVRLWHVRTGKLVRVFRRLHQVVRAIALTPDGRTLAIGYDSGELVLWNVRSARASPLLRAHQAPLRSVSFSADGHQLISSDSSGQILLWQLKPRIGKTH